MYSPFVSGVLFCHELCGFNLISSVEYIPAWFPGAGFQRIAKANCQLFADIRYLGYDAAHAAHVSLNKITFYLCGLHSNRANYLCRRTATEMKVWFPES